MIFLRALDQLIAEQICVLLPPTGNAREVLVIFQFNARAPCIVRADASQKLRSEIAKRVVTLCPLRELQAVELERANRVRGFFVQIARDTHQRC